jgi:hypothetical protein
MNAKLIKFEKLNEFLNFFLTKKALPNKMTGLKLSNQLKLIMKNLPQNFQVLS